MGVRGVAVVLEPSSSSALQGLWRPALGTSLPLEGIPGPQAGLVEDGAPRAQSLLQETGWRSVGDRDQLLPGCPSPVAGGAHLVGTRGTPFLPWGRGECWRPSALGMWAKTGP